MRTDTLTRPNFKAREYDAEAILKTIEANVQQSALQHNLIEEGETFALTPDQERAIEQVLALREEGIENILIKAPTGSGKTEVEFRVAVQEYLKNKRPVIILVPTRDLSRQHYQYYVERIKGTPLYVAEFHGGVSRGYRRALMEKIQSRRLHFVIASTLILQQDEYTDVLNAAGLIIVDDVNAFDEEEHLSILQEVNTPMIFASATPKQVSDFLETKNAFDNLIEMKAMPFNSPPTKVHRVKGNFGEDVLEQIDRATEIMERHLSDKGRIFVISRTRANVPRLSDALEARLEIPVASLHGEMVDSQFQANRMKRFGQDVPKETRIEMMKKFKDSLPSVLVATNLVGSGIDIPHADLIVITDADSFGEHEQEQLIGRVGRRSRASEAVLITQTIRAERPKRRGSFQRGRFSGPRSRSSFNSNSNGNGSGSGNRDNNRPNGERNTFAPRPAASNNGQSRPQHNNTGHNNNAPKGIPGRRLSDVL